MKKKIVIIIFGILLFAGCAQEKKEIKNLSVEKEGDSYLMSHSDKNISFDIEKENGKYAYILEDEKHNKIPVSITNNGSYINLKPLENEKGKEYSLTLLIGKFKDEKLKDVENLNYVLGQRNIKTNNDLIFEAIDNTLNAESYEVTIIKDNEAVNNDNYKHTIEYDVDHKNDRVYFFYTSHYHYEKSAKFFCYISTDKCYLDKGYGYNSYSYGLYEGIHPEYEIFQILKIAQQLDEVEDLGNGKYKIKIFNEHLTNIYSIILNSYYQKYQANGDLEVTITIKDNYLATVFFDTTDMIMNHGERFFNFYKVSATYKNYNNTNVKVPSGIK